ncbi:MAG TPA: hypothetical protein VGR22_03490 [Thermomicrobiales bacterium]|nr:hypothetical protein [Thermomicrobiales bacterium]
MRAGASASPSDEETALFLVIPARRTNRKPFQDRALPDGLVNDLRRAAEREGAWMWPVDGEHRVAVADLVDEGDRIQWADRRFRSELAHWLRPARRGDGLSSMYMYGLGPLVVRWLDLGKSTGRKNRELAMSAPLLMVLGTGGDGMRDWLVAGQALARVLLRARIDGVDASYLNQPVQVSRLRPWLADLVRVQGWPQVLLCLGYGTEVPASSRRPVDIVLEEAGARR